MLLSGDKHEIAIRITASPVRIRRSCSRGPKVEGAKRNRKALAGPGREGCQHLSVPALIDPGQGFRYLPGTPGKFRAARKPVLPHVTLSPPVELRGLRGVHKHPSFFVLPRPRTVSTYFVGTGVTLGIPYFAAHDRPVQVSARGRYSQPTHPW